VLGLIVLAAIAVAAIWGYTNMGTSAKTSTAHFLPGFTVDDWKPIGTAKKTRTVKGVLVNANSTEYKKLMVRIKIGDDQDLKTRVVVLPNFNIKAKGKAPFEVAVPGWTRHWSLDGVVDHY